MGTVVVDPFYEALPAHLGLSFQELLALKHPSNWLEFERGSLSQTELLSNFFAAESGRKLEDPAAMVAAYTDAFEFIAGMEALLSELVQQGHRLWVLSNYPTWYQIARQKLKLDRFFAKYVVSCDIGWRKPAPQAFQAVLESADCLAGQCLFIDDRQVNIEAAQQLGFQTILFHNAADLRARLHSIKGNYSA